MSIKAVLFDLDGTLLPMEQEVFIKTYFKGLGAKLAMHGYEPKELLENVWTGTMKMIKNDGSKTNDKVFWDYFVTKYGEKVLEDIRFFDEFYENNFDSVASVCGHNLEAAKTVDILKEKGLRIALATNPVFPPIATIKRIGWARLSPEDFEIITNYENSRYCKPNPNYYMDILNQMNLEPEECLMVGNDVSEDMVAEKLGMKVFLLTDCLINSTDRDISDFPNGSFKELLEYVEKNIKCRTNFIDK
ncbi:MAG: HAD family hydrolase [Lachnospiraceae bacterium]|nr:HAD family hydrolase [Lachnospiraceae bacterium]